MLSYFRVVINFTVVDDAQLAPPLQSFDEFVKAAETKNPDVRASSASFQAAKFEVTSAQSAYLPTLTLDYFYGIDAPHFAAHEPDGFKQLIRVFQMHFRPSRYQGELDIETAAILSALVEKYVAP